jgi:hypothetical protein
MISFLSLLQDRIYQLPSDQMVSYRVLTPEWVNYYHRSFERQVKISGWAEFDQGCDQDGDKGL